MSAGRKQHRPGHHPTPPQRPGVLRPLAAAPQGKKTPAAPPAYRPQPPPATLQRKVVQGQPGIDTARMNPRPPAAPPVYRPQPILKVMQPKAMVGVAGRTALAPIRPQTLSPAVRGAAPAHGVIQRMEEAPNVKTGGTNSPTFVESLKRLKKLLEEYEAIQFADQTAIQNKCYEILMFVEQNQDWNAIKSLKQPGVKTNTVEKRMNLLFQGKECHSHLAGQVLFIIDEYF